MPEISQKPRKMIVKTAEGQVLESSFLIKDAKNIRPNGVTVRLNLNHVEVMGVRSFLQCGLRVCLWSHPKATCLESVCQQISMAA